MALKPNEIVTRKLPRKLFGVDPEALQTFLAQIAATLQKTNDELTRTLIDRSALQQSLKKATAKIEELEKQIADLPSNTSASQTIAGIKASSKEILDAARTSAAETLRTAQKEAEETIVAAKAAAEEILQAARTDAAEALRTAKAQADETIAMAKAAAETLGAVETQAEETITAAKTAAEEILQAARTDAAETLRTAETQAQEKIAMATAAAETLETSRAQADEMIAGVKAAAEEILQAARNSAAETPRIGRAQAADETIALAKTAAEEILQATRKSVAETLRTAKAQADEMIAGVKAAAEEILQAARTSAAGTSRTGRAQAADETIALAKTAAEEILQATRKSAAETLKAARKRAKEMLQVAEHPAVAKLAKLHAEAEQAEVHVAGLAPKVESLVREIQNETLPRLTGLLRQLKQQGAIRGPEPSPGAPRYTGEGAIASRPPVEAAPPRVKTVGVVDFYAPIPLGASEGVILERFAADDIADLLARAVGASFSIIPRAMIQQAETAMRWRDEDVLGSERLSTLARTVGADWLIVGLIPMLTVESRDIHGRFTGEASVVVRVFDATQGRTVAETRQWGSKVGDARPALAEQVLHRVLESTVPSVISTLTAQT